MNGLVIDGNRVPVPSTEIVTWLDDPKRAPQVTDGVRRKKEKVKAICLHTSRGVQGGVVQPGSRKSTLAERLALYQARTDRDVSWHLTIDSDGTVLQQADLATWMCWHAGHANGWTIGIELVQWPDSPDLWQAQLDALVAVCAAISSSLSIPRRLLATDIGMPTLRPVTQLLSEAARDSSGKLLGGKGERWAGVVGHCNLVPSHIRGPGDPGACAGAALDALVAAGWTCARLGKNGELP